MLDYSVGKDAAKLSEWHYIPFSFWKSMNGVLGRAFPRMLFWVILMYYHSSTGQNQSEEKGFVTPSFSLSRCNVTSEKIDQEMYFWSRLSTPPHLFDLQTGVIMIMFVLSDRQISLHRLVWFLLSHSSVGFYILPLCEQRQRWDGAFFLLVFIAPALTEGERFFFLFTIRPFLRLWCSVEFSECMAQGSQTVTWRLHLFLLLCFNSTE